MTSNVFGGTLNLAQSQSIIKLSSMFAMPHQYAVLPASHC